MNQLQILVELFGEVTIPDAVHDELLGKVGHEAQRFEEAIEEFISVNSDFRIQPEELELARTLGPGESESISLARTIRATLIMDDRQGRRVARSLGIPLTGTIDVLLLAKEAGILASIRPILDELVANGYFLSHTLIEEATKLAGEI